MKGTKIKKECFLSGFEKYAMAFEQCKIIIVKGIAVP
jgi:hypothetical protein